MKLIIAGSRDLQLTLTQLDDILEKLNVPIKQITEVVSGVAKGIDSLGECWAECRPDPLSIKQFPADWSTHGRAAGPIRNKQMAEYADMAVVIMRKGGSRGSQNMIQTMINLNKPVYIYEMETEIV